MGCKVLINRLLVIFVSKHLETTISNININNIENELKSNFYFKLQNHIK